MNKYRSLGEIDMNDFVKNQYDGIVENNVRHVIRGELDTFLPEVNIAIEFNGLIYHSDAFLSLMRGMSAIEYHSQKLNRCRKKNILLLFIWEDDWRKSEKEIKNELILAIEGKEYNKDLFNKLTKNTVYKSSAIYKVAYGDIPKKTVFYPNLPEEHLLTRKEAQIFKKLSTSDKVNEISDPLDKDLLATQYDKETLNSIYKKGYITRIGNELFIDGKYMNNPKIRNKYKIPSEYLIKSDKIEEIELVSSPDNIQKIGKELLSLNKNFTILNPNCIRTTIETSSRTFDFDVLRKYSKDSFLSVFILSTNSKGRKFKALFIDEETHTL